MLMNLQHSAERGEKTRYDTLAKNLEVIFTPGQLYSRACETVLYFMICDTAVTCLHINLIG